MKHVKLVVFSFLMLCAVLPLCWAQTNQYRSAAADLNDAQTDRSGQQTQATTPAPSDGDPGSTEGQVDLDLLKTFDEFVRDTLEHTYYRLSYAFKDATKRTLDNCDCPNPSPFLYEPPA